MKDIYTLIAIAGMAVSFSGCAPAVSTQPGPAASVLPDFTKEQRIALGREHKTAESLFNALREQAKSGQKLAWNALPDWTGVYSRRLAPGLPFDPEQPAGGLPTAQLTPEYREKMLRRIGDLKNGIEWDPISDCRPPGHPRWLTEPFTREFIVTPNQTWLINEMVNDIRRIYTDGRQHVPVDDRIPTPNGDSIGFWDGSRLVIHTNQLQGGIYQRAQPDYTEQVETVELWQKTDEKTLSADVWVYDPPALTEPWVVRQVYGKLSDPDLRIRYWDCAESSNNAVFQNKEGTTEFRGLKFEKGKP
jgi:hypothetical protein